MEQALEFFLTGSRIVLGLSCLTILYAMFHLGRRFRSHIFTAFGGLFLCGALGQMFAFLDWRLAQTIVFYLTSLFAALSAYLLWTQGERVYQAIFRFAQKEEFIIERQEILRTRDIPEDAHWQIHLAEMEELARMARQVVSMKDE